MLTGKQSGAVSLSNGSPVTCHPAGHSAFSPCRGIFSHWGGGVDKLIFCALYRLSHKTAVHAKNHMSPHRMFSTSDKWP